MSYRLLAILAMLPNAAAAQTIVAVAEARYVSVPRSQTLSTEAPQDSTPNANGEILVPLGGWQRYRLSDITTTGGRRLPSLVALWKLDGRKDGRYLFVLEKLPAVDAKRFQATYRVLEASLSFEAVCLDKLPAGVDAMHFGVDASGKRCYSTYELLRSPHVR